MDIILVKVLNLDKDKLVISVNFVMALKKNVDFLEESEFLPEKILSFL